MKLWLLEILACPLDHAFPLECVIFKWQHEGESGVSGKDAVKNLLTSYQKGNVLPPKMETPVIISKSESGVTIKDDLIIKPTPAAAYLEALLEKISELSVVHDKSAWEGEKALNLIRNKIQPILQRAKEQCSPILISDEIEKIVLHLFPQLEFLNLFKYHLEIEDAVLSCPQCKRWFPVFETIPQLLPDALRDKSHDQDFITHWKEKFAFKPWTA